MAYYNCLLFDVDDTLLDFGAAERAALGEMFIRSTQRRALFDR